MPDVAYAEIPAHDELLARAGARWRSYVRRVSGNENTNGDRRANGQFASAMGHHEKRDLIAKVARLAAGDGGDPLRVGRCRFDAARSENYPQLPCARSLCAESGMALSELIMISLSPHAATAAALERDPARAVPRGTPDAALLDRVAIAASELHDPLTPNAFDLWAQEREAMAHRRGWSVPPEPNSQTLISRFGSWPAALRKAGVPVPKAGHKRARPIEELLDEFIDQMGFTPVRPYFEAWCGRMDISVSAASKRWDEAIERTRAHRAALGKGMPAVRKQKDSPELPEARPRVARAKPKGWWTRERCIAALVRWGREELGGRRPRTRDYRAWSKGQADAPGLSTLQEHGTFGDLCREAGL